MINVIVLPDLESFQFAASSPLIAGTGIVIFSSTKEHGVVEKCSPAHGDRYGFASFRLTNGSTGYLQWSNTFEFTRLVYCTDQEKLLREKEFIK